MLAENIVLYLQNTHFVLLFNILCIEFYETFCEASLYYSRHTGRKKLRYFLLRKGEKSHWCKDWGWCKDRSMTVLVLWIRKAKSILKIAYPNLYLFRIKVRVRTSDRQKREPTQPEGRSGTGKYLDSAWGISPIQAIGTLWGQGRRAMEDPYSPHSQDMKENTPSR